MRTNRFNDGRPFQTLIESILKQYQSAGSLRVKKVEPPTRIIGGGKFARKVIHLANPYLDYLGCWSDRGGRMVTFEAKSTREPRLPLWTNGVTENQIVALRLWEKAGAVTFVLWEHAGEVRLFRNHEIDATLAQRRHLKLEDGIFVPAGTKWIVHDFLQVMEDLWLP